MLGLLEACTNTISHNLILPLTVIAVPQEPVVRTVPQPSSISDDSDDGNYDYTERRTLPISIPDYQTKVESADKYVVVIPFLVFMMHLTYFL